MITYAAVPEMSLGVLPLYATSSDLQRSEANVITGHILTNLDLIAWLP